MTLHWEALVVGINDYQEFTHLHPLTVAAKDAEDIASLLEASGYEPFRVQRLPQQLNQKGQKQINPEAGVNLRELREALSNLLTPPPPNSAPDLALLFFSGHGWPQIVNGQEDVFLATSDVFPDEGIYGISVRGLGKLLQKSPVKKIVVWLDCCYSGELLKYIPRDKDYCIITATRSFEPGIELAHQNGVFTKALLEGLNPENYADGIVDSDKLANFIKEGMAQTGQEPQIATSKRSIILTTKFSKKAFRDECPYRSLSYFTEKPQDAQVFYGRSKLTEELVHRVEENHRLIAVFGASGSGKSSLLRAGLLYQLKLGQMIPGSNNWSYIEPFTPTDDPLGRLSEVMEKTPRLKINFQANIESPLKRTEEETNSRLKPTSAMRQGIDSLADDVADDKPIILIIDQFEECFTMCSEINCKVFLDYLTKLLEEKPNFRLIIGMREDFRGRLREHPQFAQKIEVKVNVGHLNREEIREAIEKPAAWVGLGIEGDLKQQLINDVEDYPGSLPLLQYTLTQLWDETRKQDEVFLRLETYQKLGRIEGTLEKRAEEVFNSLSPEEQAVARRIFLELTQVGDSFDIRRRVQLGELVNKHHSLEILDRVTQKLAHPDNRLITRTADYLDETGEERSPLTPLIKVFSRLPLQRRGAGRIKPEKSKIIIDVVHEALIRHWGRLRKWQEDYKAAMIIERKIEAAAHEWEQKGKKNEYLLQGTRLGEALKYVKAYEQLGMLDGVAEEYILTSFFKSYRYFVINSIEGCFTVMSVLIKVLGIGIIIFSLVTYCEDQNPPTNSPNQSGQSESPN